MNKLLEQSRTRLSAIERSMNRVPPGYPLGYVLETFRCSCTGCGRQTEFSRLLSCMRAGGDGKRMVPTGASETVYDLEISQVTNYMITPRCAECISTLPKQGIPKLPPPQQRLKPQWAAPQAKNLSDLGDLDL